MSAEQTGHRPAVTRAAGASTSEVVSLGRQVIYRGKVGLKALRTATVIGTVASIDPAGAERDPRLRLSSSEHVHLFVFTPNEDRPCFVEYDVAPGDGAGQWSWPPRDAAAEPVSSASAYQRAFDALASAQDLDADLPRLAAWVDLAEAWMRLGSLLAGPDW